MYMHLYVKKKHHHKPYSLADRLRTVGRQDALYGSVLTVKAVNQLASLRLLLEKGSRPSAHEAWKGFFTLRIP